MTHIHIRQLNSHAATPLTALPNAENTATRLENAEVEGFRIPANGQVIDGK